MNRGQNDCEIPVWPSTEKQADETYEANKQNDTESE